MPYPELLDVPKTRRISTGAAAEHRTKIVKMNSPQEATGTDATIINAEGHDFRRGLPR